MIHIIGDQNRKNRYESGLAGQLNKELAKGNVLEGKMDEGTSLKQGIRTNQTNQIILSNPEDYLLLSAENNASIGLRYPAMLVSKEVTMRGSSWKESYTYARSRGAHMLSLRRYVDFLKTLRSENTWNGKGVKDIELGAEIERDLFENKLEISNEWINAMFVKDGKDNIQIQHNKPTEFGGEPQLRVALLRDYCKQNRPVFSIHAPPIYGLSYDDWLNHATDEGLPPVNIAEGSGRNSVHYIPPREGCVASFGVRTPHGSKEKILWLAEDPDRISKHTGIRLAYSLNEVKFE